MPSLGSISVATVLTAVVLAVAGCYSGAPAPGTADPPRVTASPEASPVIAVCPNFVDVVETGPTFGGEEITEGGPLAQEQSRLEADMTAVQAYASGHPGEFASIRWENGPRVRIVVGFTGRIEEHCAALRAILEYPDEFEIIRQPATEARLEQLQGELFARYREVLRSIGRGAGVLHVGFRADGEAAAAEVRAAYGDLVEITVGMLPYPDPFALDVSCGELPGPLVADSPFSVTATLATSTVRSGHDFRGTVTVTNTSAVTVLLDTGQPATAILFEAGSDRPVGFYEGGIGGTGFGGNLAPGESLGFDVLGGTASCDPAIGYALPPGSYEVRVPIDQYTMHDDAPTEVSYLLSEPVPLTIVP
ncbi:MAG TPA: hypothetical protein VFV53_05775 [Candidatus Limnocylindrales bacterium]|nr:hypothetical protein [Candidatus Limnocylindrales bacterium]